MRRWLLCTVACFAAGLVTAAAVAWVGPLVQVRWGHTEVRADRTGDWGWGNWVWSWRLVFDKSAQEVDTREKLEERRAESRRMRPWRDGDLHAYVRPPRVTWVFVEAGWPRRAFWGWQMRDRDLGPQAGGIVELRKLRSLNTAKGIEVPYLPKWGGLMASSAVFSAGWFGVVALCVAGRWGLRVWRGR